MIVFIFRFVVPKFFKIIFFIFIFSSFALTKPYKGALQEVKLLKTGCDFWYVDSVKINFEDKSANSTVVENTFTCGTEKVNESAPFNVCKLT